MTEYELELLRERVRMRRLDVEFLLDRSAERGRLVTALEEWMDAKIELRLALLRVASE